MRHFLAVSRVCHGRPENRENTNPQAQRGFVQVVDGQMPRNFSCFVGCIKAAQARVVMSQANFGTLHMLSVSAPLVALVCLQSRLSSICTITLPGRRNSTPYLCLLCQGFPTGVCCSWSVTMPSSSRIADVMKKAHPAADQSSILWTCDSSRESRQLS